MTTTLHKITAALSGTNSREDWEIEYEITYRYAPEQPLRFYKRNGDPADPPDPEIIEFVSVRWEQDKQPSDDPHEIEWATEWLEEHSDEAREKAMNDLESQGAPV